MTIHCREFILAMKLVVILISFVINHSLSLQLTNIHACTEDFCSVSYKSFKVYIKFYVYVSELCRFNWM